MLTSYMPPMSCCSCVRITGSLGELRPARGRRIDSETLEDRIAAAAAGLEPDLVEPQHVLVEMRVGALRELIERIHHRLEFLRQLREHAAEHPALAAGEGFGKNAVGAPAHGDVIVDVDQLAGEALREEPGDEQRDVAQALQIAIAVI